MFLKINDFYVFLDNNILFFMFIELRKLFASIDKQHSFKCLGGL